MCGLCSPGEFALNLAISGRPLCFLGGDGCPWSTWPCPPFARCASSQPCAAFVSCLRQASSGRSTGPPAHSCSSSPRPTGGGEARVLGEAMCWSANLVMWHFRLRAGDVGGSSGALLLSGYAVMVFASLAATLGAFFLEQRDETRRRGCVATTRRARRPLPGRRSAGSLCVPALARRTRARWRTRAQGARTQRTSRLSAGSAELHACTPRRPGAACRLARHNSWPADRPDDHAEGIFRRGRPPLRALTLDAHQTEVRGDSSGRSVKDGSDRRAAAISGHCADGQRTRAMMSAHLSPSTNRPMPPKIKASSKSTTTSPTGVETRCVRGQPAADEQP